MDEKTGTKTFAFHKSTDVDCIDVLHATSCYVKVIKEGPIDQFFDEFLAEEENEEKKQEKKWRKSEAKNVLY
jgi:hypothetical protein